MTSRLLIVEDEPEWRDIFSNIIEQADDIVVTGIAGSLQEARTRASRQMFDCALVDLGLPDGSGLDFVAEFAQEQPDANIAVCTVFEDERSVLQAIRAGASGYILKQDVATDLLRLIAQMQAGGAPLSPRIARHILRQLATADAQTVNPPEVHLTPRELEVLNLVAKGMTLRGTAEVMGVAESTARSHVKNLYSKLGVKRRSAAVLEAMRHGLLQ